MSISTAQIKLISKSVLKDNYISCAIVTVIIMSSFFVCSNITAVLALALGEVAAVIINLLICFLILAPLCIGAIRYFWRLCCGVRDNPVCVFYYFSSKKVYLKTLRFTVMLCARILAFLFVFSIPVFIAKMISGTWLYTALDLAIPIWTVNFSDVTNFLIYIAVALTLFSSIKFYLAPMLFVADENLDVSEVLHFSAVISKRTYFDYLFFGFGFLGWILLSLLVIPMVFTLPYILIAYLVYSSYAVSAFNEKISKINQDDIPTYVAGV